MIKIIGQRGSGTTSKLIEISAKEQIPILTTKIGKYSIMENANILGYKIPTPIIFEDDNRILTPVLVDNCEIFLAGLLKSFNYDVKGIAFNKKDIGEETYEL